MTGKPLIDHFLEREALMIENISEIVEIESPSHDVERSRDVVDWLVRKFEETGAEITMERIASEGFGEHLIIRAFPSAERAFLLVGHTDTVHPVGTKTQNPTRVEDGKLYGCGVFDMKANIVVIIEALRYFATEQINPPHPINIFLSCDEEVGSVTGRAILEKEAANAGRCFVFEPSAAGRVKTGRKGTAMYALKAHGIPAHAGLEPEKGASSIVEIARQIEAIQALGAPETGTTVNVCTIKGGTTTNVIPEHTECTVDVRFTSMAEAARVDSAIRLLTAVDERVRLEITGDINRPPLERTDAVVSLFENARELAASFDYEIGETQVGGASDGNFVAAMGVPVLDGLGITGDGAHTLHEHILVSDIARRAALVSMLLATT